MAIGTDSTIVFTGTQDTVTSTTSSVADGAYSVSGDITTWTADDDAPDAAITLASTFASAPDVGSVVLLFARKMNVEGTNDDNEPSDNFQHTYLGLFSLDAVTSEQFCTIDISMQVYKSSSEYDFYIKCMAGQTMSAGWDAYPTPKTLGPHA